MSLVACLITGRRRDDLLEPSSKFDVVACPWKINSMGKVAVFAASFFFPFVGAVVRRISWRWMVVPPLLSFAWMKINQFLFHSEIASRYRCVSNFVSQMDRKLKTLEYRSKYLQAQVGLQNAVDRLRERYDSMDKTLSEPFDLGNYEQLVSSFEAFERDFVSFQRQINNQLGDVVEKIEGLKERIGHLNVHINYLLDPNLILPNFDDVYTLEELQKAHAEYLEELLQPYFEKCEALRGQLSRQRSKYSAALSEIKSQLDLISLDHLDELNEKQLYQGHSVSYWLENMKPVEGRIGAQNYRVLQDRLTAFEDGLGSMAQVRRVKKEVAFLRSLITKANGGTQLQNKIGGRIHFLKKLCLKVHYFRSLPDLPRTHICTVNVEKANLEQAPLDIFVSVVSSALTASDVAEVQFNISYTGEVAQDAGGLTREFFQTLYRGVFSNADKSRKSLFSFEGMEFYDRLGSMFRHHYLQRELKTGKNIDNRDLEALFNLPMAELEIVEQLITKRYFDQAWLTDKMHPLRRIFEKVAKTKSKGMIKSIKMQIEFLESYQKGQEISDEIRACVDDEDEELTSQEVMDAAYKSVRGLLFQDVQKIIWFAKSFNRGTIKNLWDIVYAQGAKHFSDEVQGSVNRAQIISTIRRTGDHQTAAFHQKVEWTEEWIGREETTDEQLENFLSVATGARCNYYRGLEFVAVTTTFPMFRFHDCFGRIEVFNGYIPGIDNTKEKHFAMLEDVSKIRSYDMA